MDTSCEVRVHTNSTNRSFFRQQRHDTVAVPDGSEGNVEARPFGQVTPHTSTALLCTPLTSAMPGCPWS